MFNCQVSTGSEPISFQQFQENISKQMGLPIGSFELRYKDDEGDVIAISSDMELQEAVRQASTRNPAVIEVIVETRQKKVEEEVSEKEKEAEEKVQEQEEQISHPEGISKYFCSFAKKNTFFPALLPYLLPSSPPFCD
jgi:hypothetical protein